MAITKGNVIKISEIVSSINTNLKDFIQGKIVYHKTNVPSTFTATVTNKLHAAGSLNSMAASGVNTVGNTISFSSLKSSLKTLYENWSLVRKLDYKRYGWQGSNGSGSPTQVLTTHVTNYAYFSDAPSTSNFQLTDLTGTEIKASQITDIITTLKTLWTNIPTEYFTYSDSCHSDCHASCHGSGGSR